MKQILLVTTILLSTFAAYGQNVSVLSAGSAVCGKVNMAGDCFTEHGSGLCVTLDSTTYYFDSETSQPDAIDDLILNVQISQNQASISPNTNLCVTGGENKSIKKSRVTKIVGA